MNAGEFKNHYLHLCRGFDKESTATNERLRAMFGRLGNFDSEHMRDAVSWLLLKDRFPSFEQIHSALESAKDRAGSRIRASHDSEAKARGGVGSYEPVRNSEHPLAWEGAKLYAAICREAWDTNKSPAETAELVATFCTKYPTLWPEVHALRHMGEQWKNAAGESTGDGKHRAEWLKSSRAAREAQKGIGAI